ncbi:MAG: hypothetical protein LC803_13465 [Acidobacteria bacterium]|nr:hypothetical protein [Acidobacteriota bacterium]
MPPVCKAAPAFASGASPAQTPAVKTRPARAGGVGGRLQNSKQVSHATARDDRARLVWCSERWTRCSNAPGGARFESKAGVF